MLNVIIAFVFHVPSSYFFLNARYFVCLNSHITAVLKRRCQQYINQFIQSVQIDKNPFVINADKHQRLTVIVASLINW